MSILRTRAAANLLRGATSTTSSSAAFIRPVVVPRYHLQTRQQSSDSTAISSSGSGHHAQHAVSAPVLADIEKRWESMPPQEQAELWMALRDRMKGSWADLTLAEKKASYWIAFGPHGPRAMDPPGSNMYVFKMTMLMCAISAVLFLGVRQLARPAPKTLTKEWQEASNEYLRGQKVEPITGVSSEGYTGKGMVQSAPASKS